MEPLLLLPLFISFYLTFLVLPAWIRKAKSIKLFWRDMNKYEKIDAAGSGGLIVILGFILGVLFYIALKTFYFQGDETTIKIFALTTSILILAGIGIIDDLLGWRHGGLRKRYRILLCFLAAIPLIVINAGYSTVTMPLLGRVYLGLVYPLILIPIGIAGAATTFNLLAGFNGLEASQGILILSGLSLVAFLTNNSWLALIGLGMVFALLGFWVFNKYPSRVFPGNVLTYPVGGLIAIMAILGDFERVAVFFFIPYILETFLKIRGRLVKESFGLPMKDNSLKLRYEKIYSLTHLSILILGRIKKKVYEKDVVYFLNLIQLIFIVLGFLVYKNHIF